jgi:hypothetical protein
VRRRRHLSILLIFTSVSAVKAETVVDVSKEWNAHVSSSTPVSTVKTVNPKNDVMPESAQEPTVSSCGCDTLTAKDYLDESTYAFTGTVSEVSAVKKGKRTVIFDVDENFKGPPALEMKVNVEAAGTDCDLSFAEGQSFLVFARWEWGTVSTSRCMGTKFLAKAKTAALGPSEELKEKLYIRLRNACMGRIDTSCCLSSLKAMRAGYFIPQPEEGCPSETIPDRLRCGGSYSWCIPVTDKDHRQP